MRNIFRIHPLTYIFLLLVVITSHFHFYMCFMTLIIIHELGHIISGYFFHWNLQEIILLPFGMISKYNNLINNSTSEEIIVASMGVIFQLVFYFMFLKNYSMFSTCNLIIIVFNLLPIFPLDGSRIINGLMNKMFNFRLSYLISIYLSNVLGILIIIVSLLYRDLLMLIIFLPLLFSAITEWKNRKSVVNKFYLERYLYQLSFDKIKYINGKKISKMKKDYYHYFLVDKKIINEDKILANLFDKQ